MTLGHFLSNLLVFHVMEGGSILHAAAGATAYREDAGTFYFTGVQTVIERKIRLVFQFKQKTGTVQRGRLCSGAVKSQRVVYSCTDYPKSNGV